MGYIGTVNCLVLGGGETKCKLLGFTCVGKLVSLGIENNWGAAISLDSHISLCWVAM